MRVSPGYNAFELAYVEFSAATESTTLSLIRRSRETLVKIRCEHSQTAGIALFAYPLKKKKGPFSFVYESDDFVREAVVYRCYCHRSQSEHRSTLLGILLKSFVSIGKRTLRVSYITQVPEGRVGFRETA